MIKKNDIYFRSDLISKNHNFKKELLNFKLHLKFKSFKAFKLLKRSRFPKRFESRFKNVLAFEKKHDTK